MIQSKLPNVCTTIFTVMSKMANDHSAINLSQGFPDFPIDQKLIELTNKAMLSGANQYAPMPGLPILRENLAAKVEKLYHLKVNADDEVTITSGATEALFCAITAVVESGDEVIVFEPAYDSYHPVIELCGGKIVPVELSAPNYQIPWDEVRDKINDKTKLIIINTPQNPTGTILKANDLEELEAIVDQHGLFAISDEVYEHLIYDGERHESALRYPALYNRTFVIYSFGKVFHTTGWKMGYCIAPKALTKEFRKVHQFVVFSSTTPMQLAIAKYLEDENNYLSLSAFFEQKRNYFNSLIKDSRFEIIPCQGTYFQLLSYKNITDLGDMEFASKMTKENGIASIPMSAFYGSKKDDHILRFCFAKQDKTLLKAAEKLCKI